MATIDDFYRVFNAYALPPKIGGSIEKGDNMNKEKVVKITKVESKVSERTGNDYWKVSTSPALVPKKAWFINNEEQADLLEEGKHYLVEYHMNDEGYIQVDSFDETEDVNQDLKDEAKKGTKKSGSKGGDFRTPTEIVREKALDFANQHAMKVMEITKKAFLVDDVIVIAGKYEQYQLEGTLPPAKKEEDLPF
jgi:hypothetical protein